MKILLIEGNPRSLIAQGCPAYVHYFENCLRSLDPTLDFDIAEPFEFLLTDAELDSIDGAVFTGSSTQAATDAAEYAPQRQAMEKVFDRGIPSWGSCAGLQLAAVVLGGAVGASPNGFEIGLAKDLVLTPAGHQHTMMRGRPRKQFSVPCIHRDEVRHLPPGAELLAGNDHSPVQAFAYEDNGVDFWGTQYHPELPARAIAAEAQRLDYASELCQVLDDVAQDAEAADQLGAHSTALQVSDSALELANWLMHVREQTFSKSQA